MRAPTTFPAVLNAPFEINRFYERLIELRRTKPEVFAIMSPAQRLALGCYEAAKRRAAMLAEDETYEPSKTGSHGE